MSELYELIEDQVAAIKAAWADAAEDGKIDMTESWGLVKITGGAFVGAIVHVSGHGTPAMRRECVLEAVDDVAQAIADIDIQRIPNWIEPLVDRFITGNARNWAEDLLDNVPGFESE